MTSRRHKRSNQNPQIEEEQTLQWPKEKGQKDKQRSTKHTHAYGAYIFQKLCIKFGIDLCN